MKIAQISDIHSGSFFNKTAVKGGVEMLLAEKPDVVFFTGDLVNNVSEEVDNYIDMYLDIVTLILLISSNKKLWFLKIGIVQINQIFRNFSSKINIVKFNIFNIIYRGFSYGKFITSSAT